MGRVEVSRADGALYLRFPGRGRMRLRALTETEFVFLPRGVSVAFEILKASDEKLSAKGWCDYVMVHAESGRPAILPGDIVEKYSV